MISLLITIKPVLSAQITQSLNTSGFYIPPRRRAGKTLKISRCNLSPIGKYQVIRLGSILLSTASYIPSVCSQLALDVKVHLLLI